MRLVERDYGLRALTFEYRGMAGRELEAAKDVARRSTITEHRIVRLPDLREAGDIRSHALAGSPRVYIPARNSIFYSFAASYAEEVGAGFIVGGHNKDDTKLFDDAAPSFFSGLQRVLWSGSAALRRRRTRILLPLAGRTKAEVVKLASTIRAPLELTWSCHKDGRAHCWRCDGCRARKMAFKRAGVIDPLLPTPPVGKIQ